MIHLSTHTYHGEVSGPHCTYDGPQTFSVSMATERERRERERGSEELSSTHTLQLTFFSLFGGPLAVAVFLLLLWDGGGGGGGEASRSPSLSLSPSPVANRSSFWSNCRDKHTHTDLSPAPFVTTSVRETLVQVSLELWVEAYLRESRVTSSLDHGWRCMAGISR